MTEFTWFQAKIKIEIEKLCVYYWIALYLVLTFRYGRDIGESNKEMACYPSLVVSCRVLTEFTWFQAKIKIEIEKLCVYYWIALYLVLTFKYRRDRGESSMKVACYTSLVVSCRVLTEFTLFQAKIKIKIEKLCVYYWIALYLVLTFRYGRDIGESNRKVAFHPSLVVSCRVLTKFTWFQAKIKIEIEKLCVYYWIALYLVLTFRYGRDIGESSRKVACQPSLVVSCRVLTEFTWFQAKIKIEIEKLCVYYWIALYLVLTFRYGRDIGESNKEMTCYPSLVVSCRVLTEFTWFQAKIKIEIEKLCVYYWIALYLVLTFKYRRDRGESSMKVACYTSLVVSCRVLTEFTLFQAKIKIKIEKLCVYYWIALYLVLTFRYGRDIGESSRKVACQPSLVVSCRVLTEFTWFQAKIKIEVKKLCVYYWIALYLVLTFRYRRDIGESSRKVACHPSLVVSCRVLLNLRDFKRKSKLK